MKELTERFELFESKQAKDGSVDIVDLSKKVENGLKRMDKSQADHIKRVLNFETRASESLTQTEALHNDFKKKMLKIS